MEVEPVSGHKVEEPQPEIVAKKFSINGEILIIRKDGKDSEVMVEEEFKGLPDRFKWKAVHTEAMASIAFLISEILKKVPNRKVPLTREECVNYGIDKKELKHLSRSGYLVLKSLKLNNVKGQHVKDIDVVYFTPQGRAYMKNIWEQFNKKENVDG